MENNTLTQIRRDKFNTLGGKYPLAKPGVNISTALFDFGIVNFPSNLDLVQDFAEYEKYVVTLHGRISAMRKSGGIAFVKIFDTSGSIQLILTKNNCPDFESIKNYDLGDIVEVTGYPCLSKTNEKSIFVKGLSLMSKCLLPPPEKWAGIEDGNNNRVLDLISNEDTRNRFILRSSVIEQIRHFFRISNFLEVETPYLQSVASGANAKPFSTHHNASDSDMFLRIAPELSLKKLLVGGFDKVYEIGKNFRNEGISTRHNPEFTMVEFYENYVSFEQAKNNTQELIQIIDACLSTGIPFPERFYNDLKKNRSFTLDKFVSSSMRDAVLKAAEVAGISNILERGNVVIPADKENLRFNKIDFTKFQEECDDVTNAGEYLAVCFEHIAEPFLTEDYMLNGKSLPVFITDFPKAISPLARVKDDDPDFCERFELYLEGRELANGFAELNDPDEQKLRFEQQALSNQKDKMEIDHSYIEALRYGLPPCCGVGLGIDRLVMSLTNSSSIRDVILFPK